MHCLLVAATAAEIAPFLEKYRESNILPETEVLVTGVGLTATTWSLTKQLSIKRPELVIQAGIAGCFDKNVKLGSVFAIKQDAIADMGVMEKGRLKTIFDLGLQQNNQFPFTKGWLVNSSETLKKIKLKKVASVSVNQVSTGKKIIEQYITRFNPVTESMEGAALHYTCLMEKIPFIQLRSISNYTGERNKKNWKIKEAILNLNHELIRLLTNL